MQHEIHTDTPVPAVSFPRSYDDVITEHPQIPHTLKALREKRNLREIQRFQGRYSEKNRDSTVEGFIGMGDEKITLGIDDLAVKVLHEKPGTHYSFDDQIAHLKRGEDVEGLEQLVTGDRQKGIIITELMPGQNIASISAIKLARMVKPEHITRLEATLEEMRERELDFDNVGNILFDPNEGFNFVDYRFITFKGAPIGSEEEPWDTVRHRERQEEMSVETVLKLAATMRRFTSKGILDEYGELRSSHGQRSRLGELAIKTAFGRLQK